MEKSEKWKQAMLERRGKKQNKPKYHFVCKFCKKDFYVNKDTFTRHVKYYCKENINRINNGRVGRHCSDEQKRKMSETMKRKINEGSFIPPYKRNHSSKISFPEKYFEKVFKNEKVFCEKEFQVGLYSLDFAWPDSKKYVEIDGEQHFVDKKIVEHDKERTEKLDALGWKCICRIRWAEYQKLSFDEKELFIRNVVACIKNEFSECPKLQNTQYKKELEAKNALIEECKKDGRVNSLGRACPSSMLKESVWEERKNLILNSGVDLNKFGCLSEIERKTGLTRRQIKLTIERFAICYKTHNFH